MLHQDGYRKRNQQIHEALGSFKAIDYYLMVLFSMDFKTIVRRYPEL